MALNGYIETFAHFGRNFLTGPLFIAWGTPLLVPVCAGSCIAIKPAQVGIPTLNGRGV